MRLLVNVPRAVPALLLAGSVGPLGFALFTQYALGLPPCHYCLLQRYPYLLPLLAGLLALRFTARSQALLMLGMLGWAATMGVALYHVGIEQGFIVESGGCSAGLGHAATPDDVRDTILGAPIVACNNTLASFAGLSMAAWNALGALSLLGLGTYLLMRKES